MVTWPDFYYVIKGRLNILDSQLLSPVEASPTRFTYAIISHFLAAYDNLQHDA